MQSILQSGFLQALAYALLYSIWQMGLLWLAVVLIIRIVKLSSSQKFTIAFTAQAFGFIFFICSLINNYTNQKNLQVFKTADINYLNNTANYLKYAMPFVAMLYIIILIWQVLKLFFNYRFTQNLRGNSLVKMPAASRVFLQELVTIFSLHRKVKIYLSKTIKCPLTIGFFKPVILIPLAAVNYLTKEQMEAVILHELAHIKRADYLLNLLQCVIEKIFFFNIFSKMLNDIIERERENACDDWVIQFKYNSFHYAEALLKMGRLQTSYSLTMAASGKKENILFYRIKRLIHPSEKNISSEYSSFRFSILTLLIMLGLIISFSSKTPGIINPSDFQNQLTVLEDNKISSWEEMPAAEQLISKNKIENSIQPKKFFANNTTNETLSKDSKSLNKPESAPGYQQKINSDYLVSVNNTIDSVNGLSYSDALNKQYVVNANTYKKVLSYQNFKQLETMLELTGDSINVTEDQNSKDNYKKFITIETTDKNGNKNIYQVIVELYQ